MYWTMDYFILNENPFAATRGTSFLPSFSNLYRQTFLSFDFQGFINLGAYTAVVVLVTFCIIDMFGTIGSIIGTASKTGLVNERGDIPGIKEALTSEPVPTSPLLNQPQESRPEDVPVSPLLPVRFFFFSVYFCHR